MDYVAVPAVAVKICGLTDETGLRAALQGGALYLGFVFVKGSKRYISCENAASLIKALPQSMLSHLSKGAEGGDVTLTALFVNPSDSEILSAIESLQPYLGLIQLHGDETPERVAEVKHLTKLPVMKAIRIASKEDLADVSAYEAVSDRLLFDAKVDGQAGGTGHSFDWSLLKELNLSKPWMLAGGLTPNNVRDAVAQTRAQIVDVSSGVEGADGKKDPDLIRRFLSLFTMCRC